MDETEHHKQQITTTAVEYNNQSPATLDSWNLRSITDLSPSSSEMNNPSIDPTEEVAANLEVKVIVCATLKKKSF